MGLMKLRVCPRCANFPNYSTPNKKKHVFGSQKLHKDFISEKRNSAKKIVRLGLAARSAIFFAEFLFSEIKSR